MVVLILQIYMQYDLESSNSLNSLDSPDESLCPAEPSWIYTHGSVSFLAILVRPDSLVGIQRTIDMSVLVTA